MLVFTIYDIAKICHFAVHKCSHKFSFLFHYFKKTMKARSGYFKLEEAFTLNVRLYVNKRALVQFYDCGRILIEKMR